MEYLSPETPAEAQKQAEAIRSTDEAFWASAEGHRVRVTRLVIYEGSPDWVLSQLGRSLPEGVREVGRGGATITVIRGEGPVVLDG